jgi:DNA recombination protein RmuC
MLELIYLLFGLLFGAGLIAYFYLQTKKELVSFQERTIELEKELITIQAQFDNAKAKETHIEKTQNDLTLAQQHNLTLEKELSTLKAQLASAQESEANLAKTKEELKLEFENLSNKIFTHSSQQSKLNIEQVLKPFSSELKEFKTKVEQEGEQRLKLGFEIERLQKLNRQMADDAVQLTNALKGSSKVRGDWGEVILERILESSGLRVGQEYEVQGSFTNDEGNRLRPDVIVHLPEEKDIIIDSKLSLNAYVEYSASGEEEYLKAHIASIKNHIKELSAKSYHDIKEIKSLDYVLMFMPIEHAFSLALSTDESIYQEAFDKRIILVSPTTLFVTLKTIENIWRVQRQTINSLEIAEQAGAMYDKFVGFVDDLSKVGDMIDKTHRTYEEAYKKLSTGRGNLINKANKLKELGVKHKKELPISESE